MTDAPPVAVARPSVGFVFRAEADAASTFNLDRVSATLGLVVDGIPLNTLGSTALFTGQTVPSENGLYAMTQSGPSLAPTAFDEGGNCNVGGLSPTGKYDWVKGNATSAEGLTTLTASGVITPNALGQVLILGPVSTPFTGSLRFIGLVRDVALDTSPEYVNGIVVRVTSGLTNFGSWQYVGVTNPVMETDPLPWTKLSSSGNSSVLPPTNPSPFTSTIPTPLDPCAQVA